MYNKGFPVANFTYNDRSGARAGLFSPEQDGLCVPFFFVLAERGEPGKIYYGGANELFPALGEETFRPTSKFYNPATHFLNTAMAGQGVNVMRLVDPTADTASLVLFAKLTPANIIQYQLDSSGKRVKDANGADIALTSSPGVPLTEPGYRVTWSIRVVDEAEEESYNTFTPSTVLENTVTSTVFPVLGFKMKWPGSGGNRMGFRLFSPGINDSSLFDSIGSTLYRFVPMELPTAVSTTASPITNLFGSDFVDISFKNNAIYDRTNYNYSFENTLSSAYTNQNTGESLLPYDVFVYSDSIAAAGDLVLTVSEELGDISPYQIDLISGKDVNGNLYQHLEVTAASRLVVNSAVTNYCLGGSDGATTFEDLNDLVKDWHLGSDHGEFTNLYQHQMTHFYDPGFKIDTKYAMFNMLDLRDNFKIDVSTQDVMLRPNTMAEDIAAGQALAMQALLRPESTIAGVGCHRVGVYAHTAKLVGGDTYGNNVPFTLHRLTQRRDLNGGLYVQGSSGGFPNSQVTIFQQPNWVGDDDYIRSLAWSSGLNVVMHASRTQIFYPSLRTVYPNDTSLLSDDELSDHILYAFKIARRVYTQYAGVRRPATKLFSIIKQDIDRDMVAVFGNEGLTVRANVYQTAEDKNLGYSVSIDLNFSSSVPTRQSNFTVNVTRAA